MSVSGALRSWSDLDPVTELEQEISTSLFSALSRNGAKVHHHGTTDRNAPASAPADITVRWTDVSGPHLLLVEATQQRGTDEFIPIKEHLNRACDLEPQVSTDVLYLSPRTGDRMVRAIADENRRRESEGIAGRILFLAHADAQRLLATIGRLPSEDVNLEGLGRAASRWADMTGDATAATVFEQELLPASAQNADRSARAILEDARDRQERLQRDIQGLENSMRERGITGETALNALIHLFFMAIYEARRVHRNPRLQNRLTRAGFAAYRAHSIPARDRAHEAYRDRTIHHLMEASIQPDPEFAGTRMLDLYKPIPLDDAFVEDRVLPVFENYPLLDEGVDVLGAVFEALARRAQKDHRIGQYFTPDGVVHAATRLAGLRPTDVILDPACGTGRFLGRGMATMLAAARTPDGRPDHARRTAIKEHQIIGTDIEPWVATIARMNMFLHGDGKSNVGHGNGLALGEREDVFGGRKPTRLRGNVDVVLMNPPLGDLNFRLVARELSQQGHLGPLPGDSHAREAEITRLANSWIERQLRAVPCRWELQEKRLKDEAKVKSARADLEAALRAGDAKAEKAARRSETRAAKALEETSRRIAAGEDRPEPQGETAKGGALFLSTVCDYLRPTRDENLPEEWSGGLVSMVIDDSVLNTKACSGVRDFIRREFYVHAVVSLPRETFAFMAKTTAKTSLLVLTRKTDPALRQRDPALFASARHVGYTMSGTDSRDDLPAICDIFEVLRGALLRKEVNREQGEPTAAVPSEILSRVQLSSHDQLIPTFLAWVGDDRAGDRLDFEDRSARRERARFHNAPRLKDLVEEVVRTPDADTPRAFAFASSVDGRVRPKNGRGGDSYSTRDLRVLEADDVLVSGIDMIKGATGVVNVDCAGRVVSKEFFTLRIREDARHHLLPESLVLFLRSPGTRALLSASGVSNRTRVTVEEILNLPLVGMPAIEEQIALAEKMRSAFLAQDEAVRLLAEIEEAVGPQTAS